MHDPDILSRYNYDEFIPPKFSPWQRFHESPRLGEKSPDFPLWDLEGRETSLGEVLAAHAFTIVEFGSFT